MAKRIVSSARAVPPAPTAKPAPTQPAKVASVEPAAPTKEPAAPPASLEMHETESAPVEPANVASKPRKAAPKVYELRVGLLELEGTQSRASLSKPTVTEYAEAMAAGATFPPVVVFHDTATDSYWVGDGYHRVHAAIQTGRKRITCEVHEGTQRDALLYSVGANATHGLRRTNADKRNAVELLLADSEWSKASDRWIAEKCGVDHKTVGKRREELSTGEFPQLAPRIGQDGKSRALPKIKQNPTAEAADEATALADLESEIERRLRAWTWAPDALASALEKLARAARKQSLTKEEVNG